MLRLILCLFLFTTSAAMAERRVALVLGTAQYDVLRPLDNPLNDAFAISESLKGLGFEVFIETDRSRRRTLDALRYFAEDVAGADLALVFYAGHGLEVEGKNLLLPTDADPASVTSLTDSAVPLADVTQTLRRIAPKAVLLIDACRTDPFTGADGTRAAVPLAAPDAPVRKGLGRIGRADGLIYGFAAAPGQPAEDGMGENSPFTEALLRHLATQGLDVRSVLTLVQQDVYDRTRGRQLPYFESGLAGVVFAAGETDLPERERLLLAMAEIAPDDRTAVERIATANDMPLAPLYGALIGANLAAGSKADRDAQLAEAAAAFVRVQSEIKTLSAADPRVTALRAEADKALALGAFDKANATLARAAEIDSTSRETLTERLIARTISEAETLTLKATAAATALRRDQAIADLIRATALYDEALRLEPGSVIRQAHVLALEHLREIHEALGDLSSARRVTLQNRELLENRVASDPQNLTWQRDLSVIHGKLGTLAIAEGNLSVARGHYADRHAIAERLAAADPDNNLWQGDLSASHSRLGNLARAEGDLDTARSHYAAGLAIAERLAAADPANSNWQRDLSVSHNKLGDIALAEGNLDAARGHYTADLAIAERLAAADPANSNWQRDLSVSHNKLGDIARDEGDLAAARSHYAADLAIAERLAASDPANSEWQRDLSISHTKLGDIARDEGNLDAARSQYAAGRAIRERLAAADPANSGWQRDLSISHNKLGDIARDEGNLDAARTHYAAGLTIAERLAAADPANSEWQRDLSVSHNKLGDIARDQGDLVAARDHYTASLAIRERLAAADPANSGWQRDLSVSHTKLGDTARAEGDLIIARSHYAAGLAIRERLAAADPANSGWQRDLAVSHQRVALASLEAGDRSAALDSFKSYKEIVGRLARSDPRNVGWQWDLLIGHYHVSTAADDPLPHLENALAVGEALAARVTLPKPRADALDWLRGEVARLRAER